jgi:hypothetical protein
MERSSTLSRIVRISLCLAGLLAGLGSTAQEPLRSAPPTDYDAATRAAVERGLAWLAAKQRPSGAWWNKIGYKLYEDYQGEEGEHVGVTALAGLAFMGAGNLPGRGKYGAVVEKALNFVLSCCREEDGYITHQGSRMYSHAFATLFLAEIYGMTRRRDVRDKLKGAVELVVNCQTHEGGWRYQPIPIDADVSVTVSTLQALRAARNGGIDVPKETVDRAERYVRACARSRGRAGFQYQYHPDYGDVDARVTFPLTACGVVSLYSAGEYSGEIVRNGLVALERLMNAEDPIIRGQYHYLYGHYYASQAFYMAGGDMWTGYWSRVRPEVLAMQRTDGSWVDEVGPAYSTAMACIILQIPCEWLPIFQK